MVERFPVAYRSIQYWHDELNSDNQNDYETIQTVTKLYLSPSYSVLTYDVISVRGRVDVETLRPVSNMFICQAYQNAVHRSKAH